MIKHPLVQKFLFCIACALAGWIAAYAMPPASFWPAMFIGLSGLYYLFSRTQSAGQAFFAGFFFALGYFVTGLWWIGNALLVDGNEYAWVWPISVIGLPTLLALFTGTYLAIARMIASPQNWKGFLAFCFFLTFSEWARGNAFTGFPWNLYGYVWADHLAMAQLTRFIGAYGLTIVSVLWATLGGYLLISSHAYKTKILAASLAVLSMIAVWAIGQYRLDTNPTQYDTKTGLIVAQPNIPQDMKWDPVAIQQNFVNIVNLSRDATFDGAQPDRVFIVWPETAISPAVYTVPENMDRIHHLLESYSQKDTFLVTGILRRLGEGEDTRFSNSVVLLDKDLNALDFYDKYHLVPFGEFIPLQKWIPLKPVASFRGFERGHGAATISHPGIPAFSPMICYEVIFPDNVVDKNGERPSWIVNVTNDGWYGDSAGPHQHFAQTRLRAIEEGIPLVRSANTGISGVIDPFGRILQKADIFEQAALTSYMPVALPPRSPYWPWVLQIFLPMMAVPIMIRLMIAKKL